MTLPRPSLRRLLASPLPRAAVLGAALLWVYWPTLRALAQRWAADPQYSHGYLVPLFAGLLLWLRRGRLAGAVTRPSAWGLALLAGGCALRLAGAYFYYDWFEALSLLPCVAGLALVLGGWPVLRWAWPAVAFLAFMVPLPYQAEVALSFPLRRLAAGAGAYGLQALGYPALAEGNVIALGTTHVGVAEACSGLGMLVVFVALALALCLVLGRPLWHKAVLVASAVPIAVVANVLRITATGVLYQTAGRGVAEAVYHDLAGWLMMPLALALLALELAFLKRLFVLVPAAAPAGPIGFPDSAVATSGPLVGPVPAHKRAACGHDLVAARPPQLSA